MSVARVTKVIGTSPVSFQDAMEEALRRASRTLRGITELNVVSQRVRIENNEIREYITEIDITFMVEDSHK
jgi:flavin-binding protein dodecin